jgi:hypothetical protein
MKKKYRVDYHDSIDIGNDHYHFQVNVPIFTSDYLNETFEIVIFKNGVLKEKVSFLYIYDYDNAIEELIINYTGEEVWEM